MPATPIFHVDAFTDRPFAGNPAAVCLLPAERPAAWMQSVAAEMNLSETAFVRPLADHFELRWFTPTVEVDLCGHATLASAHVLWSTAAVPADTPIRFQTKSGLLTATRAGDLVQLDFPTTPVEPCSPPAGLLAALRLDPVSRREGEAPAEPSMGMLREGLPFIGRTKFDYFIALPSADDVRALAPDFGRLAQIDTRGIIVTAASDDPRFDFVSRFFCPAVGIDEDPVTGSAHCALAPYWAAKIGKTHMIAYQASRRGGVVHVETNGARTLLAGHAVTITRGELVT